MPNMENQNDIGKIIDLVRNYFSDISKTNNQKFLSDLFIFEYELNKTKELLGLKIKLDNKIISNSIVESFSNYNKSTYFRPVDYQFNILNFLAERFNSSISLRQYIDDFVNQYKEQLKYSDIIISNTGATRCKTNIRFAVNSLRNIGLIRERNKQNQRTWSPTIFGLMVLLYILFFENRFFDYHFYKTKSRINLINDKKRQYSHSYEYDAFLIKIISELQEFSYFSQFIAVLQNCGIKISDFGIFKSLFEKYQTVLLKNLEITDKGIKEKKTLKREILYFLHHLNEKNDYMNLYSELFKIYREYLNEKNEKSS